MQPPTSFGCDNSSSWVCIGVFKPKRLIGTCSSEELAARIASISLSFTRFAKTAVLKARSSNQVAIFSVWERSNLDLGGPCEQQPKTRPLRRRVLDRVHGSLSRLSSIRNLYSPLQLVNAYEKALSAECRVIHMSWYEVSCWDCKEIDTRPSAWTSLISSSLSSPPLVHGDAKRLSCPSPISAASPLSHSISCHKVREDMSLPSSTHTYADGSPIMSSPCLSSSTSPLNSSTPASTIPLVLGDIVHLRCIIGSRQAHLQDVLSYSCLAILKAYFPQTEGLLSYTFYRSLDGSSMVGLGVWRGVDAASAFLNAPDGACEERYWRSMGAKARFEIYEVSALVE